MRTIYKYPLRLEGVNVIPLPKNAKPITVMLQYGSFNLWAEVDNKEKEIEHHYFFIVGTGQPLPKDAKNHLTSIIDDHFVWHIYSKLYY